MTIPWSAPTATPGRRLRSAVPSRILAVRCVRGVVVDGREAPTSRPAWRPGQLELRGAQRVHPGPEAAEARALHFAGFRASGGRVRPRP